MACQGFECSVCNKLYGSYFEWINHLLGPTHQNLARNESRTWDQETKECSIVAYYAGFSMDKHRHEVVEHFSNEREGIQVTDFVILPKIALVQFESSDKVEEVISKSRAKFGGPTIEIRDLRLQIKRAKDTMEFEWGGFFPGDIDASLSGRTVNGSGDAPSKRKRTSDEEARRSDAKRQRNVSPPADLQKLWRLKLEDGGSRASDGESRSTSRKIRTSKSSAATTDACANIRDSDKTNASAINRPNECSSLKDQFAAICQEILIPDDKYNQVLELVRRLKHAIKEDFPMVKLVFFRHWYLKIKNMGTNYLLIFVDLDGILEGKSALSNRDCKTRNPPLKCEKSLEPLVSDQIIQRTSGEWCTRMEAANELDLGNWFDHNISGTKFSLVTSKFVFLETQTCKLLKYLTMFDKRVIPVLTIVNYWAVKNRVTFSSDFVTRSSCPFIAAEPAALEWMVITFLGKKHVIPTVREILKRPHTEVWWRKHDIGFQTDPTFPEIWSTSNSSTEEGTDEFIKNVLGLVREFFEFYSDLPASVSLSYVLNTLDGELITARQLFPEKFDGPQYLSLTSLRLTTKEQEIIKSRIKKDFFHRREFVILNPLFIGTIFSFDNFSFFRRSLRLMQNAAKELKKVVSANEEYLNTNLDLKSLFISGE